MLHPLPISVQEEMLRALKDQHAAIDALMAMLISKDSTFRPSKSGDVWDALVRGIKVIEVAETYL